MRIERQRTGLVAFLEGGDQFDVEDGWGQGRCVGRLRLGPISFIALYDQLRELRCGYSDLHLMRVILPSGEDHFLWDWQRAVLWNWFVKYPG